MPFWLTCRTILRYIKVTLLDVLLYETSLQRSALAYVERHGDDDAAMFLCLQEP